MKHVGLLITGISVAIFTVATGVCFGLYTTTASTVDREICEFVPLNSTEIIRSDIDCEIVANHTISCGTWRVVKIISPYNCDETLGDFEYNDRTYHSTKYICYVKDCEWDDDNLFYNIILPRIIAGAFMALGLGVSLIYFLVNLCYLRNN